MKVYLSRSNAADPAVYSIVKAELERLGHEVVQFDGGTYSDKELLECQALVIVPGADMLPGIPRGMSSTELTDETPYLGRGQFGQIHAFAMTKADIDDVDDEDMAGICTDGMLMIVQEIQIRVGRSEGHNIYVSEITDIQKLSSSKSNWKTAYGFLQSDESHMNLEAVLGLEESGFHSAAAVAMVQARPSHIKYDSGTFAEKPMLAAAKHLNLI